MSHISCPSHIKHSFVVLIFVQIPATSNRSDLLQCQAPYNLEDALCMDCCRRTTCITAPLQQTHHTHWSNTHRCQCSINPSSATACCCCCCCVIGLQGAPTPAATQLRKVQHPTPMTSLASMRDKDELVDWSRRLENSGLVDPEAVQWVVEPKVDGLALRAVYR